jgi:hypothetical protein
MDRVAMDIDVVELLVWFLICLSPLSVLAMALRFLRK